MTSDIYRYTFDEQVPLADVRYSFLLAAIAAEGVHGQAQVLLEAGYALDEKARTCVLDATTAVGKTVSRIFTTLLTKEFGERAFTVERISNEVARADEAR